MENRKSTSCSDHFWKMPLANMARCLGAKRILKLTSDKKCPPRTAVGAKNGKRPSREALFEVKIVKARHEVKTTKKVGSWTISCKPDKHSSSPTGTWPINESARQSGSQTVEHLIRHFNESVRPRIRNRSANQSVGESAK